MLCMALICGGPSQERGISLNSARSFLDHTLPLQISLRIFYVDLKGQYHELLAGQLYCNTPSDFDFKLQQMRRPLTESEVLQILKGMDLVFPMIHGSFGEDGTLQEWLENHHIPFIGSSSLACRQIFHKYRAKECLKEKGFQTLPSLLISSLDTNLDDFWEMHGLDHVIVKPTVSGSSIGVVHALGKEETLQAIKRLWTQGFEELLLEPFCLGREFTLCVLENQKNEPVSFIPIEISIENKGWGILDYRSKYLPTASVRYHCPPHFEDEAILHIRKEAERLFAVMGFRDFARIDGWLLSDGGVVFSDFNPISGMEQNSFLFQQAALIGLTHTALLHYLLQRALSRYSTKQIGFKTVEERTKKPVFILMGGTSSERHVSLMSGSNVWLKLLHSSHLQPVPFLFKNEDEIWLMPYPFALYHTVEETLQNLKDAPSILKRVKALALEINERLETAPFLNPPPFCLNLAQFLNLAKKEKAFVFIALHGGMGEDGTLQEILKESDLFHNGSDATASRLCMDKHQSACCIKQLMDPFIQAMPQLFFSLSETLEAKMLWKRATQLFDTEELLVKPRCDGCSTGVVRLNHVDELENYLQHLQQEKETFHSPYGSVEMPNGGNGFFLIEPFIQTDKIVIDRDELVCQEVSGWFEVTIGVVEKEGQYSAFEPSLTVATSHVLSLEEKFQGGTGVNITPPPPSLLSITAKEKVKQSACKVAKALNIRNYARLDLFVRRADGVILLIEANTLPALTPSTVLFQQAQCAGLSPLDLLEKLIDNASQTVATAV